jgi:bacillithiol biosynthesis deacetylase BshB1
MNIDVLAFGAHPDDIEIFCSGTIRKLIKHGKKCAVVDLTEAERSTRGNVELRKEETLASNQVLGLEHRLNLGIPDANIELNWENKLKVIYAIRKYKPTTILCPYLDCRHPDHEKTGRLLKEAFHNSGLIKIETYDNDEKQSPHKATNIFYYMEMIDFTPSFVVDITDEFEDKMKSILSFKSQFFTEYDPATQTFLTQKNFIQYLEARARYWGFKIGKTFGEPYLCPKPIPITDMEFFSK